MIDSLIRETMLDDNVTDVDSWVIPAANSKTSVSEGVTEIASQLPAPAVLVLFALSMAYLLWQCAMSLFSGSGSSSGKEEKTQNFFLRALSKNGMVVIVGYLAADVYMAALHMFLDHPRSRYSPIPIVRDLALDFQQHHKNPFGVVVSNHVSAIDLLNTLTLAAPLFWLSLEYMYRRWKKSGTTSNSDEKSRLLPPELVWFAVVTSCSGILAAFNHVCCHARTHKVPIPSVIEFAQDAGLLPHNEFHRRHHTPPHTDNFAFLVGGSKLYDAFYVRLQELVINYYEVMGVLFTLLQPFIIVSIIAVVRFLMSSTTAARHTASREMDIKKSQ
eukprot:TRINITY_DN75118_c0_g1_i1.p1 TRINITY_DN75118_c0_g1~~TRINITY_DN75118_c0_g1_i1.p1  ORF type:complete len:330 (+),score=57.81 TRINITY_DN75118_c0_g1_i1:78-1067(+)